MRLRPKASAVASEPRGTVAIGSNDEASNSRTARSCIPPATSVPSPGATARVGVQGNGAVGEAAWARIGV
eukprot:scaffold76160_cov30-Tisochrysis_lutea.AAC.6